MLTTDHVFRASPVDRAQLLRGLGIRIHRETPTPLFEATRAAVAGARRTPTHRGSANA